MRADMHKVIVERPRVGGHGVRHGRRPRDLDDLASKQGMRRPYASEGKDFSDHLKPLERYLRKQVGRPWNKVYSEICEQFGSDSVLHRHLRRHIFDYVLVETPRMPKSRRRYVFFYVDARSGLLRVRR